MDLCGFPPKFLGRDFKGTLDFNSKGICLVGKTGTGKTMSMALMVRDWLIDSANKSGVKNKNWGDLFRISPSRNWQVTGIIQNPWKFVVYPEFIMQLQDSYKHEKGEETALDLLNEVAMAPRLILDDLGAEKPTEYVRQATYYVINYREMHLLPTFVTSNFSMDFLDENIDPRISSRIAGMCEIIRLEGKDRRISK